jgi:hypothetical protein
MRSPPPLTARVLTPDVGVTWGFHVAYVNDVVFPEHQGFFLLSRWTARPTS